MNAGMNEGMDWLNTQACWVLSRDGQWFRLTVWIGGQRYAASRYQQGDDTATILADLARRVLAVWRGAVAQQAAEAAQAATNTKSG